MNNARVPFHKLLFSFADGWDKALMVVGTIGAIVNGFAQTFVVLIFGEVIDAFSGAGREGGNNNNNNNTNVVSQVSKVSLKFVYLASACGAAAFLQVVCWMISGERQAARIRSLYLKAILRQEIAYFDQQVSPGEVNGRMSGDTFLIQDAIGEKVGKFLQVVAAFIGGFIVALVKGWLLALVMLSTVPLIIISGGVLYFLNARKSAQSQKAYANAANVVQQTIGSIRTVVSFSGEKQAVAKYEKFLQDSYKIEMAVARSTGLGLGFLTLIRLSSCGFGIWFGARLILQNGYTGGQVFTVLFAVLVGSSSLSQASSNIAAFALGQAAAYKMFETIHRKPMIDPRGNGNGNENRKSSNDIRGEIEFRDVHFRYPSRPEEQILDGFSLLIPSGMTVALVGQSGSGKSTVISLIERFYDPQSGEVFIDGINMRDFELNWIRSKIGLVSQEPVLFSTSIRENIAYGKHNATVEEIIVALKLANLYHDFVNKLPQGLDTMVGDLGIQLSGGQKQRVAIARAIIKDPSILLLDEATSALDVDSERIVQETLGKVMETRKTVVIVAHRLSTIRNAKMIAVLHCGKVIEKGTHSELLKDRNGVYSKLMFCQEVNEDTTSSAEHSADAVYGVSMGLSVSLGPSRVGSISNQPITTSSITISEKPSSSKSILCDENNVSLEQVSFFHLAHLNKPEFPVLIAASVSSIITGAIWPVYGLLLSAVIKAFYQEPRKLKQDSHFWALMLSILGVAALVTYPLRMHLFGIAGNNLIRRMRLKCFEKVINMEIGWFDKPENSNGIIGGRLSTDAAMIRVLVGDALGQVVQDAAAAIVGLAISFEASWQMSLIVVAMIPLLGFNGYLRMRSVKGFARDAKVMYEEASQVANDAVSNIRTVASFCAEERIIEMYKRKCEVPVLNGTRQGLVSGIGFGFSMFFVYSVYAIIFYVGAQFVRNGKVTVAEVFRVYFAVTMVAIPMTGTDTVMTDSSKAKSAVASVFAILKRKSKIDPSNTSGMILQNVNGEIEFKNVQFSYPIRPNIKILEDVCFTIHNGQMVALIGESGSGKSTVISLLQRFYDPKFGEITLDGIEIHKFQVNWLRQQMGLVSQEPILFNDTIRANIASTATATESDIIAAAKLANAHDFISSLQQGYDTIVGERGIQLSGGQKQRVAIARAILKRPKVLLLDEATSALDAESERLVQETLDKVMLNRTTIVVAHRLSTIRGADTIYVFKSGRIVEKGNHNSLIDVKDGIYSSLVRIHAV